MPTPASWDPPRLEGDHQNNRLRRPRQGLILPCGVTLVHPTSPSPRAQPWPVMRMRGHKLISNRLVQLFFCFFIAPLLTEPCKKEMSGYQTSKFCQPGISSEFLSTFHGMPWRISSCRSEMIRSLIRLMRVICLRTGIYRLPPYFSDGGRG